MRDAAYDLFCLEIQKGLALRASKGRRRRIATKTAVIGTLDPPSPHATTAPVLQSEPSPEAVSKTKGERKSDKEEPICPSSSKGSRNHLVGPSPAKCPVMLNGLETITPLQPGDTMKRLSLDFGSDTEDQNATSRSSASIGEMVDLLLASEVKGEQGHNVTNENGTPSCNPGARRSLDLAKL